MEREGWHNVGPFQRKVKQVISETVETQETGISFYMEKQTETAFRYKVKGQKRSKQMPKIKHTLWPLMFGIESGQHLCTFLSVF